MSLFSTVNRLLGGESTSLATTQHPSSALRGESLPPIRVSGHFRRRPSQNADSVIPLSKKMKVSPSGELSTWLKRLKNGGSTVFGRENFPGNAFLREERSFEIKKIRGGKYLLTPTVRYDEVFRAKIKKPGGSFSLLTVLPYMEFKPGTQILVGADRPAITLPNLRAGAKTALYLTANGDVRVGEEPDGAKRIGILVADDRRKIHVVDCELRFRYFKIERAANGDVESVDRYKNELVILESGDKLYLPNLEGKFRDYLLIP